MQQAIFLQIVAKRTQQQNKLSLGGNMLKAAETNSLEDWANRKPDFPAVICGDKTLSYGEWNRQSNCVADALLKQGLKPGDRLGMRFQLCPEWFIFQRAL